ncbi:hypothetical protein DRP05_08685 [Archaeoglobales archaeon]|nr:MAG: hypothetical protein DRP05_08685 [Archaeoglobales archaeon]
MQDEKSDKPLWMPRGSIRGLIALIFTVSVAYLGVNGSIEADRMVEIIMVILAFYFGSKAGEKK